MGMPEIKVGSFTSAGTAADVELNIGFVPDFFELVVGTDTNATIYRYIKELGDASTIKIAGDTGIYTYVTNTPITSIDTETIAQDISVMGGLAVGNNGFKGVKIPKELQVNAKNNYWIAKRQG